VGGETGIYPETPGETGYHYATYLVKNTKRVNRKESPVPECFFRTADSGEGDSALNANKVRLFSS